MGGAGLAWQNQTVEIITEKKVMIESGCVSGIIKKYLVHEGVSDMHCMSDEYLAEELEEEYREKMVLQGGQKS